MSNGPVHLPGYREFFDKLNFHDRKRVLYLQWELILSDFAKGFDFPAVMCWHEAIDQARAAGIRPKKDPDDETPSRVTGPDAKLIHLLDQSITTNHCASPDPVVPAKGKAKPRKHTKSAIDKEMEAYFG